MTTFASNTITAATLSEAQHIKSQIDALQARLDVLNEGLAAAGSGKHTVEGVGSFTVSENNVYPKDAISALLRKGQFMRVSKRVIDPALVRQHYPAVYESVKDTRGMRVALNKG